MRLLLGLLFLGLCVSEVQAQLLPLQYDTTERSQEIIVNAGGEYMGNAVQNQLANKFLFGGTITDEIKDASFDKHKAINRFGGVLNGEIEYRNYNVTPFKKKPWGMVIKAGAGVFGGVLYSDDAYGLALYGNDRYVGDTIDLSGMNINVVQFQKLGFGLIDPKTKSSVSLNAYAINNRIRGDFRGAYLSQTSDGSSVTLEMDSELDVRQSSTYIQGFGLGVDADFKFPVSYGQEKTAIVQLQVKNMGVGYMHAQQQVYNIDTSFTFTGLRFNEIIGDGSILNDSLDVLDTLGVQSSMKNRTFLLPGFVQVGKIVNAGSDQMLQSFFGVRLYPTLIYVPYIYAGLHVQATDWLSFGANVGYGGFTNVRGGLYSSIKFDKFALGIATEDIVGMVSKKGTGRSLFIRLKCAF